MIARLIRRYGARKLVYLASDLFGFAVGGFLALGLTPTLAYHPFYEVVSTGKVVTFALSAFLAIASFRYHNLYKEKVVCTKAAQFVLLLKNAFLTFVFVLVIQFIIKPFDAFTYSRIQIGAFVVIAFLFISFNRLWLIAVMSERLGRSAIGLRNILAIGAGRLGQKLVLDLKSDKASHLHLVGFVDDDPALLHADIGGVNVLGATSQLEHIVRENDIHEIFLTIDSITCDRLLDLVRKCRSTNCQINILSEHFGIIDKKVGQSEYSALRYAPIYQNASDLYRGHLKRGFDIFAALFVLLLLSLPLSIVAFLIKVTSPGPVFYTPTSIGKGGKAFKFFKFRSMYRGVSHDTHKKLVEEFMSGRIVGAKLHNDPRVTTIGRFIRKFSIDEFPQLFNVLQGDMSLVGPRPSTIYEYEMMEDWHKRRYDVVPGMTGLWQVSGRSEVSFNDMIVMDLYYIENCSFWVDLVILFKTVGAVVRAKGGV
jgi:exopolysaccharide biosynthesis polyprenyl glycosylphosphotransferase